MARLYWFNSQLEIDNSYEIIRFTKMFFENGSFILAFYFNKDYAMTENVISIMKNNILQ